MGKSDLELRAYFEKIDSNGNGTLDKYEIAEAMRAMGRSEDSVRKVVLAMPEDEIDFDEFVFLARDEDGFVERARKKREEGLVRKEKKPKIQRVTGEEEDALYVPIATPVTEWILSEDYGYNLPGTVQGEDADDIFCTPKEGSFDEWSLDNRSGSAQTVPLVDMQKVTQLSVKDELTLLDSWRETDSVQPYNNSDWQLDSRPSSAWKDCDQPEGVTVPSMASPVSLWADDEHRRDVLATQELAAFVCPPSPSAAILQVSTNQQAKERSKNEDILHDEIPATTDEDDVAPILNRRSYTPPSKPSSPDQRCRNSSVHLLQGAQGSRAGTPLHAWTEMAQTVGQADNADGLHVQPATQWGWGGKEQEKPSQSSSVSSSHPGSPRLHKVPLVKNDVGQERPDSFTLSCTDDLSGTSPSRQGSLMSIDGESWHDASREGTAQKFKREAAAKHEQILGDLRAISQHLGDVPIESETVTAPRKGSRADYMQMQASEQMAPSPAGSAPVNCTGDSEEAPLAPRGHSGQSTRRLRTPQSHRSVSSASSSHSFRIKGDLTEWDHADELRPD
jgi:hypothetical protein